MCSTFVSRGIRSNEIFDVSFAESCVLYIACVQVNAYMSNCGERAMQLLLLSFDHYSAAEKYALALSSSLVMAGRQSYSSASSVINYCPVLDVLCWPC